MVKLSLLLGGLLSLPLLTCAQRTPGGPRFYVGGGASLATYFTSFRPMAFFTGTLAGPALTAGARLTPRLSLELGAAYAWPGESQEYSGGYGSHSTVRLHVLTTPLLVRYALLPVAGRWQVEGVGGVTMRNAWEYYTYSTTLNGRPFSSESVDYAAGVGLTLGPAVRYALSPRFGLTAEPLLSAELTRYDFNGISFEQTPSYRFQDRLFWNFRVGARYSFGR